MHSESEVTEMRKLDSYRKTILRGLMVGVLLLLCAGCAESGEAVSGVRVMLEEGEGYTVLSENPVLVPLGGTATFTVQMPDGYVCIQTGGGAEYDAETGTLQLRNVRRPATVSMRTADSPAKVKFFADTAGQGGTVSASADMGWIYEGTLLSLAAVPEEDYRFAGWTLEKTLAEGGTLLSQSPKLEHILEGHTFLYANFASLKEETVKENTAHGTMRITYHANGGVYRGTDVEVVPMEVGRYHVFENSLPAKDYFVREGYQLIEYNTKPDGSGDAYGLGSKIASAPDEDVTLYCIWAKESDSSLFTWETVNGGLALTSYSGNEDTVVIPESVGGKPVLRVRKGAFKNKTFTTMVIPKSITHVESGAFGCTEKFTTLYLFDNITSIPDDAFTNLKGFRNVRLNAAHTPMFTDQMEGSFCKKWEKLVSAKLAGKKVFVLVSGSSSFYGFNSPLMEELIGSGYTVVNYGTNASTPIMFYLELVTNYVEEGDIVVFAPEQTANAMGESQITWKLFRGIEYYYNAWRDVDMRRYTHFFSSLTEFNTYRVGAKGDYTTESDIVTEYGDRINVMEYNRDNYRYGNTFRFNSVLITGKRKENINWALQKMVDDGISVYVSCAPHNVLSVHKSDNNDAVFDAYMAGLRESVCVPVISDIRDYLMEGRLMYDSDWHTNGYGRDIRTRRLYEDLAAQREKEGRPLR